MLGVKCELCFIVFDVVGFYILGGSVLFLLMVLMLGVFVLVVGCENKLLCMFLNKVQLIVFEIVYVVRKCGIDKIYLCGGVQVVVVMVLGIDIILQVDKIFGFGNSFVIEVK